MFPFKQSVADRQRSKIFSCNIITLKNILVLLEQYASDDLGKADGKLYCTRLGMFGQVIKNKFSNVKGSVSTYMIDQEARSALILDPWQEGAPLAILI